ncbi:MAG: AAA family ATPase [Myxococcota bacterium]
MRDHVEQERTQALARFVLPAAAEWFTNSPPRRRWLLEQATPPASPSEQPQRQGWLPLGKVGMLAAAGGVGKTMALVQLAVSVATGRDWFGLKVANPGRALLALAEEDAEEVRRRLYAAAGTAELDREERMLAAQRVTVLPLAGVPVAMLERDARGNPIETGVLEELRAILEDGRGEWRLVVLDPLTRWAGLDAETDNLEATRFVAAVESLVRVPGGPTVILSHHTSKASRRDGGREATAARGSSALVDGVRWCATMVPAASAEAPTVELAVAKANYSRPGRPITLVHTDQGTMRALGAREAADRRHAAHAQAVRQIEERVLELVQRGEYTSMEQLRSAARCGKSPMQAAVSNLVATGRLHKPSRTGPFEVPR